MNGCLLVEAGGRFGSFRERTPIRRQHPGKANGHVTMAVNAILLSRIDLAMRKFSQNEMDSELCRFVQGTSYFRYRENRARRAT